MIDDDGKVAVVFSEAAKRIELYRRYQSIEAKTEANEGVECILTGSRHYPAGIGQVLQHRANALEQRIGRQRFEFGRAVCS